MRYWLELERRIHVQDKREELEIQLQHFWPERWEQLYGEGGPLAGAEPELPITDPSDLDQWYENLHAPRGMNGAEAEQASGGRRV